MIPIKFLPLAIPAAISGMALTTSILAPPGKTWTPFATAPLAVERLHVLNQLKTGEMVFAEGIQIAIAPQSTLAMHSLTGLGSPNDISDDGEQESYDILGTCDEVMACQRVVVNYAATAATDYQMKAVSVWVPRQLITVWTTHRSQP
jgi:hypothetical protein